MLFVKLLGIPKQSMHRGHNEVAAFAALGTEAMIDTLFAGTTKESVDAYYEECFSSKPLLKAIPDKFVC